jgi:hypothetical protein
MNFKANPPFNEMRQGFATSKKETRMASISSRTFSDVTIAVFNRSRVQRKAILLVAGNL